MNCRNPACDTLARPQRMRFRITARSLIPHLRMRQIATSCASVNHRTPPPETRIADISGWTGPDSTKIVSQNLDDVPLTVRRLALMILPRALRKRVYIERAQADKRQSPVETIK